MEDLRRALASRDELIAVMGHELRNAMAPLVLLTDQFEQLPTGDDLLDKKVGMMSRYLRSFRDTVDRVSEVSQLRAGKLRLDPTSFDAAEMLEDVCLQLAPRAKASRCELRCIAASVTGRWDRARLSQIATHLIGNALRYASGAPIDIALDEHEGRLRLVVHDHGPGIAAADRAGLFDRFDHPAARRTGGLGVGLWVVKVLCTAMGGTVSLLESGHGARFCVALPRG